MIDIYQTRYGYNHKCLWYKVNHDVGDRSRLVYEKSPSGTFHAKIVSEMNVDNVETAGVFNGDVTEVTIRTTDRIDKMRPKDLVVMDGKKFIVTGIRKMPKRLNAQYDRFPSMRTVITMRGA